MGRLADALRANLKAVAESDARALREIDQELKAASNQSTSSPELPGSVNAAALLGQGSFQQQTVATLKKLDLCKALEAQGIEAPPPPLESFSKKELVMMLKKVLGLS